MNILVTGDWHIGITSFGVLDELGRNSRVLDVANTLGKICEFAIAQNVDLFVMCGDVFHTNKPTPAEQVVFLKFLVVMEEAGIATRVIIGNHDFNSQLGKGHALRVFQEMDWQHIKIMHHTTWEMIGDCLFCFYPFAAETPDFLEVGKRQAKRTFLVCHSHLEGAVVGAEPYEIKDDKATRFKDLPVDGVLAGHFHKPQILCKQPLAFYPGSIQPVDFNERMDVKGVVVLDADDLKVKPAGFKTRRLVQYDLDQPGFVPGDDVKDAIVKVNVSLSESEAHKFDESAVRKALVGAGAHSIASINLNVQRELVKRDPDIIVDAGVGPNFERFIANKDYGELGPLIYTAGLEIIASAS